MGESTSNSARHTFPTCYVAAYGNLVRTSTLMSHLVGVETLRENYLGVIPKSEGERLFAITPAFIERLD